VGKPEDFLLPPFFEYFATFLWAVSGALLGARKGYAVLGILTLSMVSAAGGGLLRDGLFLQQGPPQLVRTPYYLLIVGGAVILVMFFGKWVMRVPRYDTIMETVDALGLGAYAVVGMNRALAAGISLPGVVVVGMVNAVGGGILRDILIRRDPKMFQPGTIEESAALAGCLFFLVLNQNPFWPLAPYPSAITTISAVFLLRLLAIRYRIQVHPLKDFERYWKENQENQPSVKMPGE